MGGAWVTQERCKEGAWGVQQRCREGAWVVRGDAWERGWCMSGVCLVSCRPRLRRHSHCYRILCSCLVITLLPITITIITYTQHRALCHYGTTSVAVLTTSHSGSGTDDQHEADGVCRYLHR